MTDNKIKLIDTHFHVWNLDKQNLPWLEDVPALKKSYLIEDYINEYKKLDNVILEGGIYVEVDSDNPILEDEILYEEKANNDKILAIVARSKVSPTMRVPLFATGIRQPLHTGDAPKGMCLEDSFIEGIKELTKNNMTFDSCNRVDELSDLVKMMEKTPDAKVVLNHLGNVEGLTDEYKNNMRALAKFPNLYVKVSGYKTEDKEFVRDLLSFVKNTFTKDRLIYASNWPVINIYSNLKEHIDLLIESFGNDEDFFYNNAKECYGL